MEVCPARLSAGGMQQAHDQSSGGCVECERKRQSGSLFSSYIPLTPSLFFFSA